jgi:hypothetical protein
MSRLAKVGLLLLLILSLGIKTAVGLRNVRETELSTFEERFATLASERGFAVESVAGETDPRIQLMEKDGCRLAVMIVSPMGWHRDLLTRMAGSWKDVSYAFGGIAHAQQPVWYTSFERARTRLVRYLGFTRPDRLVLGLISERTCRRTVIDDVAALTSLAGNDRPPAW